MVSHSTTSTKTGTKTRTKRAILLLLVCASGCSESKPTSDLSRNQAIYVPMRDGVKIAVDVWLPEGIEPGMKLPTVIRATRYWRAQDRVGASITQRSNFEEADRFNSAGYVLVLVDARGSGASFGMRRFEMAEDEVRDYGEVVDWIIAQSWSNGRVGAYGVSYAGNTAEMLSVNEHPAVKAIAPLFNDFDNFGHLIFPGGILTVGFLEDWSNRVRLMDLNDMCALSEVEGSSCEQLLGEISGVKPVDRDTDYSMLNSAVSEHEANTVPFEAALEYEFRDDPFGPFSETNVGHRRSTSGHLPQIESSGVAMFIRVGWQDAGTVNGALGRFNTISNSQQVLIGPWDHGAKNDADPFEPEEKSVQPNPEDQFAEMVLFFDSHLKEGGSEKTPTEISYYTLGSGNWTTTAVWPPEGFETKTWYFKEAGGLGVDTPMVSGANDLYTVDFSATTGVRNRWYTNGGAGDVVYPDRSEEDRKLLTYTSDPMSSDVEITGHPLVTLFVDSGTPDAAFIVYLEIVAPNGRVTYVTEGQLRGVMRAVTEAEPLYRKYGPHRSELRDDALPLVPGEIAEIRFDLWATSVLVREGHRIRIAVGGADADTFLRYPRDGSVPQWAVHRSPLHASRIDLPMRKRF